MIKQLGDPDGSVFQTASSGDSSSSTTAAESQRTSPMHNDPGTRDNSHFYQFSNFSSHDSSSLPFKKISSQPCEENKHAGPNLDMAFHVTPQGRVKSAFSPSLRHLHEDPLKKSICTQIEMLWARHRMPHGKAQASFSDGSEIGCQDMPPDYRRACTRRIASTNWGTWNESRQASKKRKASNNDAASYHVSLTYTDDNDHEYEDQDTEDDDDDDSEVEEDAEDEPITCRTLKWLSIGDRDSVEEFYRSRFCAMQQTSCRTVAKGWIRIIHPKKQSKNPYIGGNAKRPKWWPDRVLHKEPDHIKKPERVDLLVYMLRDMADRTKNPLSPRNITVEVLRKSDPDLKSALDRDPKHGAKAWELLGEIYGIRQREESYERGEIDGDSRESYYDLPVKRRIKPVLKKRKRPRAMTPTSPITPAVSSPAQSDQALMSPIERLALDKRSPSDGQPDSFDTFVAAQTSSAFPIHEDDRSTADKTSRSTAVLRELAPAVTSHSPSRIGAAFHGPLDQTPRPTRVPIVSSFVPDLGSEFGQGLNGIASNSGPSPTPLDYSVSVPASVQWSDTVRMPQNPYGHDAAWSYNAHLFHGMPNGPQVPADEQTPLLSGDLMSFPTTALGGRPEMPAYSPRQARSQPMQYQLSPGQTSSSQTMPFDPVACQSQQNPYHGQAHQAVDNRYGYRKA